MIAFTTANMLTELPYYCATKRHHNGNSTHMKVNYALYVSATQTFRYRIPAGDVLLHLRTTEFNKKCNKKLQENVGQGSATFCIATKTVLIYLCSFEYF